MNFVLVEACYAFKMLVGNIIRDRFSKTELPPLSSPKLTINTQVCAALIQVSYVYKAEYINNISRQTVAPIELQVTRTDDTMVFLRVNGTQQFSRNIILQAAASNAVRKIIVIPIQYMNKECMMMLNQNKVILVNDETSMRNPDSSLEIYLTAAKLSQCTLVAENRRLK